MEECDGLSELRASVAHAAIVFKHRLVGNMAFFLHFCTLAKTLLLARSRTRSAIKTGLHIVL